MVFLRLFVGAPVPKEVAVKVDAEFLSNFRSDFFKVVKMENLHFTICFIGERPKDDVDFFISTLKRVSFSSFKVSLSGLGHFHKSVFWLKVSEGEDRLESLSKLVCSELGVEFSGSPHLTIARARKGFEKEAFDFFSTFKSNFSCSFMVDKISLFSSVLGPNGPSYVELGFKILSSTGSGS